MPAVRAGVVGAAQADRRQNGIDGLHAVVGEVCDVASTAVHPGTAMPGVESHESLQQPSSQLDHGGADRQLHSGQAFRRGIAELTGGQLAEALYLGGEVRLELPEEPLFLPSASAGGWSPANAETGLVSQIFSLTSTTSWTIPRKCL